MSKQEDEHLKIAKLGLAFVAVLVLMLIGWVVSLFGGENETVQENQVKTEQVAAREAATIKLKEEVQSVIDGYDTETKRSLASTSATGRQGDITSVDGYSSDTVQIHVSTYFDESGEEKDGGQAIARKIFNVLCMEVPALNSLYVTSGATGLDSKSIYRSDTRHC